MTGNIQDINISQFLILAIPLLPVLVMLYAWQLGIGKGLYAIGRMLIQLIAIGYVLTYIFTTDESVLVLAILGIMMLAATWISLNSVKAPTIRLYLIAFLAILIAGSITLFTVTVGVLQADPWYTPRLIIPLAGMIYVVSMTAISLSAERMNAELEKGICYEKARAASVNAALIPTINALLAVGLVSLPGMMTGQILSGVDPLIAVKYQIVVMIMSFTATGLATLLFIHFSANHYRSQESPPQQQKAAIQP